MDNKNLSGTAIQDECAVNAEMLIRTLGSNITKYLRSDCGILFSGGVDSSLLAALSARHLPAIKLFTVGLEGSNDVTWAVNAAQLLGLYEHLNVKIIGIEDIESVLPRVIEVLMTADPMTVSLGVPLYIACNEAKEHHIGRLLAGQGADELFAGYHRYKKLAKISTDILHTAIVSDVSRLPQRDINRDNAVAKAAEIELAAPFLDPEIVEIGLSIAADLKVRDINGELVGKYILRRAAEYVVPGHIAWRDKKAFQYGSGVWAALGKCASRNGFKKQDKGYIRKYLYSVAEENKIVLDVTS
jgi:asparagine synthase (glutamine-hydrolysing)